MEGLRFYGPKLLYDWVDIRPQFEPEQVEFIEHTQFMAKETGETQLVMIPFMPFSVAVWPSGKVSLVSKVNTDEEDNLEGWTKTRCSKCNTQLVEYALKAKERGDQTLDFRAFPEIICGDCLQEGETK